MTVGAQFAGRTVLVTGAYGLVGSWLARALLDRGARVVALRREKGIASALAPDELEERCTLVHGDLVDAAAIERAVADHGVDTVFHLGAQTIVDAANRAPAATLEVNVRGTWNVLEACRLHGVQRVVVASSGKVYGPDAAPPYREEMALGAREPYDVSKACADMVARSYWQAFGLPVAVVRFTNVYGPDDRNQSRLVPAMIAAVLAGRPPVIRSDGGVQRDFLYVSDAVDACLAIADGLDAGWARGEALNAGAGEPRTVLEVAELVVSLAGGDAAPEVIGGPTTGARREWVDTEKLRTLSGWAPRVGFEEGLRRTVAGAARASEVA